MLCNKYVLCVCMCFIYSFTKREGVWYHIIIVTSP